MTFFHYYINRNRINLKNMPRSDPSAKKFEPRDKKIPIYLENKIPNSRYKNPEIIKTSDPGMTIHKFGTYRLLGIKSK